jgi:hypothetical protein
MKRKAVGNHVTYLVISGGGLMNQIIQMECKIVLGLNLSTLRVCSPSMRLSTVGEKRPGSERGVE